MIASWRNPKWRYTNAEATRAPGYLEKRFKAIRQQQEQQKASVTPIKAQKRA